MLAVTFSFQITTTRFFFKSYFNLIRTFSREPIFILDKPQGYESLMWSLLSWNSECHSDSLFSLSFLWFLIPPLSLSHIAHCPPSFLSLLRIPRAGLWLGRIPETVRVWGGSTALLPFSKSASVHIIIRRQIHTVHITCNQNVHNPNISNFE